MTTSDSVTVAQEGVGAKGGEAYRGFRQESFIKPIVGLGAIVVLIGLVLVGVITGLFKVTLPAGLASRIGFNSEAYLYAAVLLPWVYFTATRRPTVGLFIGGIFLGAVWMVLGFWLLESSVQSSIKTLNEPAIALGLMVPYVTVRRPLPQGVASALVAIGALTILVGMWAARPNPGFALEQDNWVISLAEAVGLVIITVVALDMVETWVLARQDSEKPRPLLRAGFYVTLAVVPIAVSLMGVEARVGADAVGMSLNYLGRIHESFIGVLLLCVGLRLLRLLGAWKRMGEQ